MPKEGRLAAGFILGALWSQRNFGPRTEALLNAMTIEAALGRMPLEQDDEEEPEELDVPLEPNSETPDFDFKFDLDDLNPPKR